MEQEWRNETDIFTINYDLRSLSGTGPFPWGSSMQGVDRIGAPEYGSAGLARLWSVGGGWHFNVMNATDYRFMFRCELSERPQGARFYYTLLQPSEPIAKVDIASQGLVLEFTTPVSRSTDLAVLGIAQRRENAREGEAWTIRRMTITLTK